MINCNFIALAVLVLASFASGYSSKCDSRCPPPGPLDYTQLLPHETDCSKFYSCSNCKPILMSCPSGLLFSDDLQTCDWPSNVKCGGDNNGEISSTTKKPSSTTKQSTTTKKPSSTTKQSTTTKSSDNNKCDPQCPNPDPLDHTVHLPHESDCSKFYKCDHCQKVVFNCPDNTLFNAKLEVCDWPENVDCDGNDNGNNSSSTSTAAPQPSSTKGSSTAAPQPSSTKPSSTAAPEPSSTKGSTTAAPQSSSTTSSSTAAPQPSSTKPSSTAAPQPSTTENSEENNNGNCDAECPLVDPLDRTIHLPHESDCSKFYKCDNCKKVEFDCPANLHFDKELEVCDWPENVDCEGNDGNNSSSTKGDDSSSTAAPEPSSTKDDTSSTAAPVPSSTKDDSSSTAAPEPSSTKDDSSSTAAPEPTSTKDDTSSTAAPQPSTTENSEENNNGDCDVECPLVDPLDRTIHLPHESDCSKFYKCDNCKKVEFECPANLLFNKELEVCDWPEKVDCDGNDGNNSSSTKGDESSSTAAPVPSSTKDDTSSTAAPIPSSTKDDSSSTAAPEPSSTKDDSSSTAVPEPTSTKDDSSSTVAPQPSTTENSEENNNGDCDAECPLVDPLDRTIHLPHESDCSKFYKCDNCKKVEFECPANLLFDKELEVCDWPENVDCDGNEGNNSSSTKGDDTSSTAAPEPSSTKDDSSSTAAPEPSSTKDDSSSTAVPEPTSTKDDSSSTVAPQPSTTENSEENNNGDCDAECPLVDPLDRTIHLPHESDCSKFYKCDNCKKVEFECPANLLFDKELEVCDWPENVDCDGNEGNNSSSTKGDDTSSTAAPEPSSTKDDSSSTAAPEPSSTKDDSSSTAAPEPTSTKDDSSSTAAPQPSTTENSEENNNGDCDAECPLVDPLDRTIHLPHESDCSKFYKCDNCKKVEFECPANLLFDKELEVCDWPENVDCDGNDGNNSSSTKGDDSSSTAAPVPSSTKDDSSSTAAPEPSSTKDDSSSTAAPVPSSTKDDSSSTAAPQPSTTENSEENNNGDCDVECPNPDPLDHTVHLPHESDCSKFYKCDNCKKVEFECPANLLFNKELEVCDWPENVDCDGNDGNNSSSTKGDDSSSTAAPVPSSTKDDSSSTAAPVPSSTKDDSSSTAAPEPSSTKDDSSSTAAPQPSTTENSGENNNGDCDVECPNPDPLDHTVHLPHESDCSKFYKCDNCKKVEFECPANLLFNKDLEVCDWPENVDCDGNDGNNSSSTKGDDSSSTAAPVPSSTKDDSSSTSAPISSSTKDDSSSTAAPQPSTTENSEENNNGDCDIECPNPDPLDHTVHLPHESDCSKFYKCDNCKKVEFECPANLLFNKELEVCDWPENVDCDGNDDNNSSSTKGDDSSSTAAPVPSSTKDDSSSTAAPEPSSTKDDSSSTAAPEPSSTKDDSSSTAAPQPSTTENSGENNNGDCDVECPNPDPLDHTVHLPHESDCSKFYKCDNCKKVEFECPANLLFNKELEVCDWPENVDCDGNDGNNSSSTKGDDSSSTAAPVPSSTKDDSSSTAAPVPSSTKDDSSSTAAPVPSSTKDDSSSTAAPQPSTTENSEENNNGDCDVECPNPDPLDHTVHLPHESDCSKFYKCDNCKKVEFHCPADLLFNEELEVCDWPENVDCDGNDGNNSSSTTSTAAPKTSTTEKSSGESESNSSDSSSSSSESNSSDSSSSSSESNSSDSSSSSSESNSSDSNSSEKSNLSDSNENTNSGGSSDSSGENNNGCDSECPNPDPLLYTVHLPHESNCSKFYKCDNCKKVEFDCPADLLFNTDLEVCDWPENVDCGNNSLPSR